MEEEKVDEEVRETALADASVVEEDGQTEPADGDIIDVDDGPMSSEAVDMSEVDASNEKPKLLGGKATIVVAAICAAAIGFGVGCLAAGGMRSAVRPIAVSEIAEDKASEMVVASYTYAGQAHDVTVRDAYEGAMPVNEGKVTVPSAEQIVNHVRGEIMVDEANARGIKVGDDDVTTYVKDTLGGESIAAFAEKYGMGEDVAKDVLHDSVLISKLHDEVAGFTEEPPEAPADNAGDKEQRAYEKAYEAWSQKNQVAEDAWTTYMNDVFDDATISMHTLTS